MQSKLHKLEKAMDHELEVQQHVISLHNEDVFKPQRDEPLLLLTETKGHLYHLDR